MVYKIEYLDAAIKDLGKIPKKHVVQILSKIETLEQYQVATGIKKLKTDTDASLYRLRSGDYRVVFTVEEDRVVILIISIKHRKDVYRSW